MCKYYKVYTTKQFLNVHIPSVFFLSSLCCYCEFFSLFPVSQGGGYIFSPNGSRLARNVNKQDN